MTDFQDQDLTGARFSNVNLTGATLTRVELIDARFDHVDLSGSQLRGVGLQRVRIRGGELVHVDISGEVLDVVINGVDVAPMIEAELNRRDPERAKMRPTEPLGYREAKPSLDEVLEVRRERQAMVRGVLKSLTAEQLAAVVTQDAPGWPRLADFPFAECLGIVLNEEWEHRRYAERDLTALEKGE